MNFYANRNRLIDRENKLMVKKGEEGGGINEESEINKHSPQYIKQVIDKDLLYSTQNYIQYLVINYNGKE